MSLSAAAGSTPFPSATLTFQAAVMALSVASATRISAWSLLGICAVAMPDSSPCHCPAVWL